MGMILSRVVVVLVRLSHKVEQEEDMNTELRRQMEMENQVLALEDGAAPFSSVSRERYVRLCVPLHKAALKGDWGRGAEFVSRDPTLLTAPITGGGETALHIAAVEGHRRFVAGLLQRMGDPADLEALNKRGCTALTFAAAAGHARIVAMMLEKNPRLAAVRGPQGVTPLFMAALMGHSRVARALFPYPQALRSSFDHLSTHQSHLRLLTTFIRSGLYGLAISMVHEYRELASLADEENGETALAVLARSPSAFCTRTRTRHQSILSSMASSLTNKFNLLLRRRRRRDHKLSGSGDDDDDDDDDAYALFECLWESMVRQGDVETAGAGGMYEESSTASLGFMAAESGNTEFLVELIRKDPMFLYKVDSTSGHSIFHIAIVQRHIDVFNLIYEMDGMKRMMATYAGPADGNNMLHLAAMMAPPHQLAHIPGAALRMQRQVLWYKEVEKIVQPSYRDMRNAQGMTPHELFLEQHGALMREGEKEMKHTAKSFMLVTMLITTVVFAAAFTVPGGYDNRTGDPTLGKRKLFVVFPVSEGVATVGSLASMLMFLSILTSRYAEGDFLCQLPCWLAAGVMGLFVSMAAMVAALCLSIVLYQHSVGGAVAVVVVFGSVPLMFVALKYQLLAGILHSTYTSRNLFASNHRLFP
ncbi:uncharacterized protein LOC127249926 isoform X2 [Andrographis paniculata]|nr:uncharacterized protein LOC127249926 isoform X2 [Andrographis paniculata]XP_051128967.1 uncharacterized protein LOC127249926 isoform X2 [Andrographis paniculata]